MTALAWLIPAALVLGSLGLAAFLWALNAGQFDDLDGAAWRALEDREPGAARGSIEPDDIVEGVPGGMADQRERKHQTDKAG